MAGKNDLTNEPSEREIFITRIVDAPPEIVFKAWADPEHLKNWYAPKGCTVHIPSFDFREGGVFHHCIRNPQYGDCWCKAIFREILFPNRIVYTLSFSDEQGNFVDQSPVGKDPEWPKETTVTVLFEEYNGKTRLILHQTARKSVARRTGAYQSWLEILDSLAEVVSTASLI